MRDLPVGQRQPRTSNERDIRFKPEENILSVAPRLTSLFRPSLGFPSFTVTLQRFSPVAPRSHQMSVVPGRVTSLFLRTAVPLSATAFAKWKLSLSLLPSRPTFVFRQPSLGSPLLPLYPPPRTTSRHRIFHEFQMQQCAPGQSLPPSLGRDRLFEKNLHQTVFRRASRIFFPPLLFLQFSGSLLRQPRGLFHRGEVV